MNFAKTLYIEHIKSKHTILTKLPIILSIILVAGILFMTKSSDINEIVTDSFYYWINACGIIVPIFVGVLAGIMGDQEQEAGNYQVISKSYYKGKIFLAKNVFLIEMIALFIILSVLLLSLSIECVYRPHDIEFKKILEIALIFGMGTLFLVPLQLFFGFRFGMGASVGLGIFGTVFAAYISSFPMLSEKIWRLIPWTWSVKTASAFFENDSVFVKGMHLPFDLTIQVGVFFVLLIGGIFWFINWEDKG